MYACSHHLTSLLAYTRCMRAYTHTHACRLTHTCTHTHMHTNMHSHRLINSQAPVLTQTCTRMHTHAQTNTYTHTHTFFILIIHPLPPPDPLSLLTPCSVISITSVCECDDYMEVFEKRVTCVPVYLWSQTPLCVEVWARPHLPLLLTVFICWGKLGWQHAWQHCQSVCLCGQEMQRRGQTDNRTETSRPEICSSGAVIMPTSIEDGHNCVLHTVSPTERHLQYIISFLQTFLCFCVVYLLTFSFDWKYRNLLCHILKQQRDYSINKTWKYVRLRVPRVIMPPMCIILSLFNDYVRPLLPPPPHTPLTPKNVHLFNKVPLCNNVPSA